MKKCNSDLKLIDQNDFYSLAKYFEDNKDYNKSLEYYQKYFSENPSIEGENKTLLKINLLKNNFTYSEEIKNLLLNSYGEYDLGLRNDRIYENIAEYLILINENKIEKAEAKKKDLKALLKYGQLPLLDIIIRKDSVFNALDVPVEVVNFIEKL
jgi:hypothetical protein